MFPLNRERRERIVAIIEVPPGENAANVDQIAVRTKAGSSERPLQIENILES